VTKVLQNAFMGIFQGSNPEPAQPKIEATPSTVNKENTAAEPKLSDDTMVAGQPWRDLKNLVMGQNFRVHDWWKACSAEEQQLIEDLQ
jgi:hypothetical protein